MKFPETPEINLFCATDIAKYFYLRAVLDGELLSPLKMQKMVYFAYVEYLKETNKNLFFDKIEAWPMGPVIANLYHVLKQFGSMPIDERLIKDVHNTEEFIAKFDEETKRIIDRVYEKYIIISPFELVAITHAQVPWLKARNGLSPEEKSNNVINDKDILAFDC